MVETLELFFGSSIEINILVSTIINPKYGLEITTDSKLNKTGSEYNFGIIEGSTNDAGGGKIGAVGGYIGKDSKGWLVFTASSPNISGAFNNTAYSLAVEIKIAPDVYESFMTVFSYMLAITAAFQGRPVPQFVPVR